MSQDDPPPPGQDSYEARYMKGAGRLLRREKTPWRLHWLLLPFIPVCWATAAMILAGVGSRPAPASAAVVPLVASAVLALSWLIFRTLRVHVTEQQVHIQYGVFGPQIATAAIESCQVVDYDLTRYGGWGVRIALDGSRAYTLAGDSSRVVQIRWRDGDTVREVVVSSLDPDALAASIAQAAASARPRLRAPAAEPLTAARAEGAALEAEAEAQEQLEARGSGAQARR